LGRVLGRLNTKNLKCGNVLSPEERRYDAVMRRE